MRYITFGVLSILIGVSAQLPKDSTSSELSLQTSFDHVTYEDKRIQRSLAGTNCRSSVDVTCTIKKSGLSCENNLKVRRSDCQKNNGVVSVGVKIKWTHCNKDTESQTPNPDLIIPKFKKTVKRPISSKNLQPGECEVYTSNKNINVCKPGVTMSMKYEGTIPTRPGSYCFGYAFLRVTRKWLAEKDCSVSTGIQCKMAEGPNAGEKCAGNIINDGECNMTPVIYKYQTCLWNVDENDVMAFDKAESIIKIDSEKVIPSYSRANLTPTTQCRETEKKVEIDTCAVKSSTFIKMQGSLTSGSECSSSSRMKLSPAFICDFDFILTQIVHNSNGATFVQLWSKYCPNQIVTQDYFVAKYRGRSRNPSHGEIRLKGVKTDENGFITLCLYTRVNQKYGEGSCRRTLGRDSAVNLNGSDNVAIISGGPNDSNRVILDVYGSIGKAMTEEYIYTNTRAVRNSNMEDQQGTWVSSNWEISDSPATPRSWSSYGGNGNGKNKSDNDKGNDKNKNDKDKDKNDKDKDKDKDKDNDKDKNDKDNDKGNDKNKNDKDNDKGNDKDNDKDNDKGNDKNKNDKDNDKGGNGGNGDDKTNNKKNDDKDNGGNGGKQTVNNGDNKDKGKGNDNDRTDKGGNGGNGNDKTNDKKNDDKDKGGNGGNGGKQTVNNNNGDKKDKSKNK